VSLQNCHSKGLSSAFLLLDGTVNQPEVAMLSRKSQAGSKHITYAQSYSLGIPPFLSQTLGAQGPCPVPIYRGDIKTLIYKRCLTKAV
jgi:hypothetical protein